MQNDPVAERIIAGLFLCTENSNEVLQALKPQWNELVKLSIKEKCPLIGIAYEALNMFPLLAELSAGIDINAFNQSHLEQPDLFIRIRPGQHERVIDKLDKTGIHYSLLLKDCIALPNNTKIDTVLDINKEAVIQDYSSQRVGTLLSILSNQNKLPLKTWDCCAASGGKSIMVKDILNEIDLTVSDIRESILINLKKRFAVAGIHHYQSFVADLTKTSPLKNYELIIADIPCTGSGTWGRTPERISFFKENILDEYCAMQKKILHNIVPCLQKGGYLLYITCSVFKKENEDVIELLTNEYSMELKRMELLNGYQLKADTMFAALLVKN